MLSVDELYIVKRLWIKSGFMGVPGSFVEGMEEQLIFMEHEIARAVQISRAYKIIDSWERMG